MCGIIGFAQQSIPASGGWRDKDQQLKMFVEQMLYMDALRGPHATGVMRVDHKQKNENAFIYKRALHAYDFLLQPAMDWLTKNLTDASLFVGHNRFATQGGVRADKNAHPFNSGNVSLVHNGHINNGFSLTTDNTVFEVDSAYIAHALSQVEPTEATSVLAKLNGAYALVWHDSRDNTVNIARNKDRPLYWINLGNNEHKMWQGIVFASEMEMLATVCWRTGLAVHGDFMYPRQHVLYKFKLDEVPKYTSTEYTPVQEVGASRPFQQTHIVGYGGTTNTNSGSQLSGKERKWKQRLEHATSLIFDRPVEFIPTKWVAYKNQRGLGAAYGTTPSEKEYDIEIAAVTKNQFNLIKDCSYRLWVRPKNIVTGHHGKRAIRAEFCQDIKRWEEARLKNQEQEQKQKDQEIPPSRVFVCGPGGRYIPESEFTKLTSKGCSNCGSNISSDDASQIVWAGDTKDSPICPSCAEDLFPSRYSIRSMLQ
jgi:asparagine synthetase B (glutamine-hydrolysing)